MNKKLKELAGKTVNALLGKTNSLPSRARVRETLLSRISPASNEQIRTLSRENILPYLAGIMLLGAFFLVFIVYRSFAWPFFLGMLFYVGFEGMYRRLLNLFGQRENISSALSTGLVVLIIMGPVSLVARQLLQELITLVNLLSRFKVNAEMVDFTLRFPGLTDIFTATPFFWLSLANQLESYTGGFLRYIDPEQLSTWLSDAYHVLSGGITVTAFIAVNLILALVILFFLFREGPQFYKFLREALPFPGSITDNFVLRMKRTIRAVFFGNLFVSILQGIAVSIGLTICGIPNSVVYGLIAAVFSLIPVVGTAIIWFPASLYLFFINDSLGLAIFLALWCLIFYMFLENILKPKLLDRKLGLHPLLIFFAILGGLTEFGITGVVLGPLIITLFATLWSIYHIWGGNSELNLKEPLVANDSVTTPEPFADVPGETNQNPGGSDGSKQ